MDYRVVGPEDEQLLADLLAHIDATFFRPHPFTAREARRIARLRGRDIHAILVDGDRAVAYGLLRGWDEGFDTPSLGIAVRDDSQGRGIGRVMMAHLHGEARARGSSQVRLRVHADNIRARRLYESLGYEYRGEDRGELLMTLEVGRRRPQPGGPGGPAGSSLALRLVEPGPAWDAWLVAAPHDVHHHRDAYTGLVGARPAPPARRGLADPGFFPAYRAPLPEVDGPTASATGPRPWPVTPARR